jgi:hypothetical protein
VEYTQVSARIRRHASGKCTAKILLRVSKSNAQFNEAEQLTKFAFPFLNLVHKSHPPKTYC